MSLWPSQHFRLLTGSNFENQAPESPRRRHWSWQTTRPGSLAVIRHKSPLVLYTFEFPLSTVSSFVRRGEHSPEFTFNERCHNNSLSVCSSKKAGWSEGMAERMINHQRGPREADSIASLDCSSLGKVRWAVGWAVAPSEPPGKAKLGNYGQINLGSLGSSFQSPSVKWH